MTRVLNRKVMATMEDPRIAKLKADIERENGNAVNGEVVTPASNGLVLTIKGEGFECRRVGTSWQMMQFSKARQAASITVPDVIPGHTSEVDGKTIDECECSACNRRRTLEEKRNDAGMTMLATLHDTAMVLLQPHERDRFREFMSDESMSDEGIKPGELEEAIGKVIAAAGGEEGKAGSGSSRPSSNSSTNTSSSVPADLRNKATAEVVTHNAT